MSQLPLTEVVRTGYEVRGGSGSEGGPITQETPQKTSSISGMTLGVLFLAAMFSGVITGLLVGSTAKYFTPGRFRRHSIRAANGRALRPLNVVGRLL